MVAFRKYLSRCTRKKVIRSPCVTLENFKYAPPERNIPRHFLLSRAGISLFGERAPSGSKSKSGSNSTASILFASSFIEVDSVDIDIDRLTVVGTVLLTVGSRRIALSSHNHPEDIRIWTGVPSTGPVARSKPAPGGNEEECQTPLTLPLYVHVSTSSPSLRVKKPSSVKFSYARSQTHAFAARSDLLLLLVVCC